MRNQRCNEDFSDPEPEDSGSGPPSPGSDPRNVLRAQQKGHNWRVAGMVAVAFLVGVSLLPGSGSQPGLKVCTFLTAPVRSLQVAIGRASEWTAARRRQGSPKAPRSRKKGTKQ